MLFTGLASAVHFSSHVILDSQLHLSVNTVSQTWQKEGRQPPEKHKSQHPVHVTFPKLIIHHPTDK